jgi:hypothetical protein
LNGWFAGCLLFYVPLKKFYLHLYMKMSPLPMKGCKIKAYVRRSGLLSKDRFSSCHTFYDVTRSLRFSGFIRRTTPFCRLLRHRIYSFTDPHCLGQIILAWRNSSAFKYRAKVVLHDYDYVLHIIKFTIVGQVIWVFIHRSGQLLGN